MSELYVNKQEIENCLICSDCSHHEMRVGIDMCSFFGDVSVINGRSKLITCEKARLSKNLCGFEAKSFKDASEKKPPNSRT